MERIERTFESPNFESSNTSEVENEELSGRLQNNILKEIEERLSNEVLMYYNKGVDTDHYSKV